MNAGRYICNYTYYRSLLNLKACKKEIQDCSALFVHVPDFEDISKEKQQQFLCHLLAELVNSVGKQEVKEAREH